MRRWLSLRFILQAICVLSWVLSAAWMYYQPGFEPLITFLGGAAAFIGSFFVSNEPIRILEISEEEKRARDRRNRTAMLKKVKEFWVERVLKNSLHNAVLIELGLEERKDAVDTSDKPWSMVLQTIDKPNRVLPPGTKILDVFDEVGRALLILGEPGSGKTTTLLELARQTISRAEKDSVQPIPVVFNLSSWIKPAQSLAGWLIDELRSKYYIPEKIAKAWVENDSLLLLLDGLDEVALERRNACVKAINKFRQEHLVSIVICSRTLEYESLATSLKVNSAVCIQPLTEKQIGDYLDRFGAELTAVRRMLQDDVPLRELSRSPLMLNIMTLAYAGASVEELQQIDTTEARRKHLFNKYIDGMFNRVARTKSEVYPRDKTTKWLSWLAEKMAQEAQSVFLIERMQPTLLETQVQKRQYTINTILISGLILGLIVWLIVGLFFGLIVGLFYGLIVGLIYGLTLGLIYGLSEESNTIETVESLKWSWKEAKSGLIVWLIVGLIGGLIFGLIFGLFYGLIVGLIFGPIVWLIVWLIFGLIGVLIAGLIYGLSVGLTFGLTFGLIAMPIMTIILSGLSYDEVKERTVPNQGIRQSIRNAAIVFLATVIGSALIAGPVMALVVVLGPNVGLDDATVKVTVGILFATVLILGFFLALVEYGGLSVIGHFILRFILYRNGYIPWNMVRFLDYAAERIFLQKVGGGYKFIHRLIQEHFASLRDGSGP
jgi:MFS family permease